jgi:hypothetical protein
MRYLGDKIEPKHKNFIYISPIPDTCSLKWVLYNSFNNFVHEIQFHDVEFSICGIKSVLKYIQISEVFQILELQTRNIELVI